MSTNPQNYLTKEANTDKSTQLSDKQSKHRHMQNYLAKKMNQVKSTKLTEKEYNIYRQIHRAIRQRISVGSHVTAIRTMVWSSGKFERVTLLVQSAVTQMYILTFPHRRQAITFNLHTWCNDTQDSASEGRGVMVTAPDSNQKGILFQYLQG